MMDQFIEDNTIRLQKVIADAGLTSRRKAEKFITQGRVTVNGIVCTTLGTKVNTLDEVEVDGKALNPYEKTYVVLNKPRCVMVTTNDPHGRPTVMDYVKDLSGRVYPIGRLDYLHEGLIIMTNDGSIVNMFGKPKRMIVHNYEVTAFGSNNARTLKELNGCETIEEFQYDDDRKQVSSETWGHFELIGSKYRESRRVRFSIGNLSTENINPGEYKIFSKEELLKAVGMI